MMIATINVYLVTLAELALSFILLCHTCWAARKMLDPFGAAILAAFLVGWAWACLLVAWHPHDMRTWLMPSILLWVYAQCWFNIRKLLKQTAQDSGGDNE